MKLAPALIVGFVSAFVTVAALKSVEFARPQKLPPPMQPAFERVMATHTIRCAYSSGGPAFIVNPNNNRKSGVAYDVFEQAAHMLGLQIVWAEEVQPAKVADALQAGRFDAMCMTMWPTGARAATLDFTMPLDYVAIAAYVRTNDARFDGDPAKIDNADVTIAVSDDDYGQAIADEDYPRAKQYNVPPEIGSVSSFLAVTRQKADVIFADPATANDFMKNNPGTIRQVANAGPARVFGASYAVAKGETKLRDMLDVALRQLNQNGFIRAALDKYMAEHKGQFLYPAKPWEQ